jgi:PKD repeat protein
VVSGTYQVTLTPHNSNGDGTSTIVTLYINVPPTINSAPMASGNQMSPFNYTITSLPGATSFGATGLPGWLSINTATGVLSGTPPTGGTYAFNAVATNFAGNGVQQIVLSVTGGSSSAPGITSATSASGVAGTFLSYQITATKSPTSYAALVLPTGLTCNTSTGLISGTPTTAGTYSVPISATNASGTSASEVTFNIASATSPSLPTTLSVLGAPGVAFSYHIPASGPVSFYGEIGNLPSGLNFNALTGNISGLPTGSGTTQVTVSAMNATGTVTAPLSLMIEPATPISYGAWSNELSVSGGANDTPYNDGVPNFLKYAFDIDPAGPVSTTDPTALPQVNTDSTTHPGTTYLTVTYRQSVTAANVEFNLQTSPDLQNWTTVNPDLVQQVGTAPNTNDPIIEEGVIVTGTSNQFIRLNVTSP